MNGNGECDTDADDTEGSLSSTYGLMTTPSQGDSDIESYGLPEAYGIKDENLWLAQPCHAAIASDYSAGDRNYLLGDEGLSGSYEMPCGAEGVGAVGMSSDGEEEKRLREVEREAAVGKREAEERGARGIDWNEEFQKLVGMLGETGSGVGLHVAKGARKLLYKLCDDFRSLCELYSQIIVTEAHLPRRLKTIPPADVGGYAGGTKFIVANIFFKFALSDQSTPIYPDDERAMKVAGHELRALTALSGASIGAGESIHFPLMCLVDFKGFRVICQSILPISRRSTLVYGSTNAGQSIEDGQTVTLRSAASEKPSTVFQVMRRVCSRLNLKAHAPRQHPAKVIYGPVDIEGHLGYDGRFYLLDVARLFPPKYFTRQQYQLGQQLWDQLRPELVIQFSSPLSSDALSNFQHSSETQSNREIRDATRFLTDVQVPLVASLFNAKPPDSDLSNTAHQQELVSTLHERGVNLKYMGLVRSRVTAASWRTLLLLEIVARTLKNEMRLMLRETHSQGEHVQKLTLLKTFRKLIGTHHASHSFWEQLKPIFLRRFPNSLTIEELDPSFDLLQHISLTDAFVEPGIPRAGLYGLVCRVQRICGLKFTRSSKTLIKTNLCDFDFTLADFIGFQPICKDMAISSYTQAMVFHEKALKRGGSKGSDRLASLSRRKFTETLERQPNNVAYLEGYASALRQTAAVEQSGYQRYKLLKQTLGEYLQAQNFTGLLETASVLAAWYQTERSSVDLRSSILRSSLEGHRLASLLNPTDGEVMMSWARLLTKAYAPTRDINYLLQAAQKYRLMWGCLHASPPSTSAAVLDSLDQSSKDSDSLSLSDSGNQPVHSLSPYLTPADAFHLSPMLIRQGSAPALPDTPNPLKTYPEWLFELAEPLDLLTAVEIYQANLDHIPMSSSASSSSPASRVHREWTVDNRELPYLSFSALPLVFRRARVTYLHLDFTLPGADDTFSSQLLEAALTNSRGHLHELSITESVRLTSVAGFTAVATHLTRIDFSGSRNILAPTLTKLIKGSGPTLKHLALREVGYVCDRVLGSISKHAHGLRHLNLDRCRKASPAGFCQLLGQLGRLRELDLSGTQLTSVAIRRAKCLSRLTQLRLNHCLLLDSAGVMGLASQISSQLNELQLSGIKASDRSFSALAKACSGLISLSLQSLPSISDGTIQKFVSRNPGLITLDLRHCPELSRRSLPVISKGCPELQSLSFDGISGTRDSTPNDKHICPIAALTWLTTLRLTHCPLVTDVSIKTTAETSPLLHTLVLDHCIQITDSSLLAIAQHCTLLKDLSLRGCKNISNSAIAAFPKRCTLERIDISGNELVCDDGLISIALTAPLFLTSIEISHCINITDRSIAALAKGCFCLQTLNVAGCRRITDQGATHLASLSALEYLNLGFCWRLTDASVCVLVRTLANLVELCLSGTSVTQAVLLAIPQTKLSKSLKSLLLSSCERVDPTGIEASLSCLNLQEIALPPRMTGASLASLTSFQRLLTHLHLSHSIIDDEMLAVAAPNLVNLRQLILRDCPSINEGLAAIATHCPLLDGLDLTNSANVSSASLTAITNHCPSLSHLLLRGCLNIDHLTVFVAIKHCRLLALVELGGLGCSHLNSSSLSTQKPSKSVPQPPTLIGELSSSSQIKISPSRPSANYAVKNSTSSPDLSAKSSVKIFSKNLTSLSVHHAALTHSAFSAIFQRSPHLTLLDLSFSFIDDRILGRIAKYCPALRIAHFVGSSLLTGAGILHLCAKLRIISEIDLSLCDGIRFDALDLLRERHPQITFVHSQKHVTQCWLK